MRERTGLEKEFVCLKGTREEEGVGRYCSPEGNKKYNGEKKGEFPNKGKELSPLPQWSMRVVALEGGRRRWRGIFPGSRGRGENRIFVLKR